jgi:O-antigen/teichoic acid export membrane protein
MSDKLTENGNLTQQASHGAFWGLLSNGTVSAVSFIGTAIMARILSPRDFGLISMAVLVTGIVNLFGNLALGAGLVQKKEIDEEYLSTVFVSSVLIGILLFVIAAIFSPVVSLFFKEPVIKWVIIFLSFNFIISSISSVQTTLLYKNVRLKTIGIIEIVSRIVRVLIMLICAVIGLQFWSIVIGIIAERILKTVLLCIVIKWRPAFIFSKEKFMELFRFGRNIYGDDFLGYFSRNVDFIVTGRILGVSMLGIYQFSYNLPYLVQTYVQDGIAPVAFPVFSKVNDDKERLSRGFFNAVKFISMITFPLMVGLSFCANDFIAVVYGKKWLPAAPPLRLLCFSAALASIHCIVGSVFKAVGRPDIGFKWSLFRLPFTVGLVVLFSRWGIIGIAAAMFFVEFCCVVLSYLATKLLDSGFKKYLLSLLPAVSGSIAMISGLYLISRSLIKIDNSYLRLSVSILLGSGLYLGALFVFYKKDLFGIISFIKLSFNKADEGIKGKNF